MKTKTKQTKQIKKPGKKTGIITISEAIKKSRIAKMLWKF